MNSHEYASAMRKLADLLESRPQFTVPGSATKFFCFYNKEHFLAAVKALKPGIKEYKNGDLGFNVTHSDVDIVLSIPRERVCTLVTPAVYDCEPLLTPEEDASLEVRS